MTDTQKATPRPWRYVGTRYPIQSPQGERIEMHVVAVDHPNGPWEAIYCKTQEIAETIRDRVNAYDAMREALEACDEYVRRIEHDGELMKWYLGDPTRKIRAALAAAEGKVGNG